MAKSLHRSRDNKMVGGVVGGFAHYLGVDATLLRIIFVAVSVLSSAFPGILVYLVLWALMPKRPRLTEGAYHTLAD